jgi:guanylate kinase
MAEKNKYLIVGPAASGKDWLQQRFVEKGYKPLVQYTTRPKRPTENGTEYHFISQKLMGKMIREMKFLSVKNFKTWWYGFVRKDFEECDVAIVSIGNINELKYNYKNLLDFCEIVYLDIPKEVRIARLSNRYDGGNVDDTVERRVNADETDFEDFINYTICLQSEQEVVNFINNIPPKSVREEEQTK